MKKIILLILILVLTFSVNVFGQVYLPMKADLHFPGSYTHQHSGDTVSVMVYVVNPMTATVTVDSTKLRRLVQIQGTPTVAPVDSTGHYLGSIAHPIYIQPHDSVAVKYVRPLLQLFQNGTAKVALADTSNTILKNIRSYLAALQRPTKVTTLDSLCHVGGAHVDTVINNPAGLYSAFYIYIKGRTNADTLNIRSKSTAGRLVWSNTAFGLQMMIDKSMVADNSTIIISANTNYRLLVDFPCVEWIAITRKTTNSVNRVNTIQVAFEGIKL